MGPGLGSGIVGSDYVRRTGVLYRCHVGVHPETLGEVVQVFEEDPALDALFKSYDKSPAAPNLLSQYRNLLHHWTHQQAREEASTFWAGVAGAVRRSVFVAHGVPSTAWPAEHWRTLSLVCG